MKSKEKQWSRGDVLCAYCSDDGGALIACWFYFNLRDIVEGWTKYGGCIVNSGKVVKWEGVLKVFAINNNYFNSY